MLAFLKKVLLVNSVSSGVVQLGRLHSAATHPLKAGLGGTTELQRILRTRIETGAKKGSVFPNNAASITSSCISHSGVSAFRPSPPQSFQCRAAIWSEAAEKEGRGEISPDRVRVKPPKEEEFRKYLPRRLEGEKKWQFAVRKKRQGNSSGQSRGSARTMEQPKEIVAKENLGDVPQGDEWRRKKIAWLCQEIPTLRPRLVITILNDQRKWIHAADSKYVIQHLLHIRDSPRAHRVFKWEMQQPWYAFDFELSSQLAIQLGLSNKLTRMKDIFDLIITNGRVPDLATYAALINCYIWAGEGPALAKAHSLYQQMSQLGGHDQPPTLTYDLFEGHVKIGVSHTDLADDLFKQMKAVGLVCSPKMYSQLIHCHGQKGNRERVLSLINEMKEAGLTVGQEVYASTLKACSKDGNVEMGEQAFADLKAAGHKLLPAVYASVIKMYVKAGLPKKAAAVLEEIRGTGTAPNLTIYELMIEVAVSVGDREQSETLLLEALEKRMPSLHGSYNAVMELYSRNGLLGELERTFYEMEPKGYPPNVASYNTLLGAYVGKGLVEKAEALFLDIKDGKRLKPNKQTYEHMIRLYGEAKSTVKLQEILKELTERKMEIPEAGMAFVEEAVRPKQLEAHRNSQLKLDREQREILAGVLLAGASMESHDRDRTYEVHFRVDTDDENRLPVFHHLFRQFSPWVTGPPSEVDVPNSTRQRTILAFQTVSHGSFRFFAHQYRPSHKAAIPRLVHRWLTPRALAYWCMYGGRRCPATGDLLLGASLYSDQEIMLVVNALRARTIDCEKTGRKQAQVIRFSGKSADWVWGLMEPYIIPEVNALLSPNRRVTREHMA